MSLQPHDQPDLPATFLSLSARTPPSSPSALRSLPFPPPRPFSPRASPKQETLDIETSLSLQQPTVQTTASCLPGSFSGHGDGDGLRDSQRSALGFSLQQQEMGASCFEKSMGMAFLRCCTHGEETGADRLAAVQRDGMIKPMQNEIQGPAGGLGEYRCSNSEKNASLPTPSLDLTHPQESQLTPGATSSIDLTNQPKSPSWLGLVERHHRQNSSSSSPQDHKDPAVSEQQRNGDFSRFLLQTNLKMEQTSPTQNDFLGHSNISSPTQESHSQSPERRTLMSPLPLQGHLQAAVPSSEPLKGLHPTPDGRKNISPQASSVSVFPQVLSRKESNASTVLTISNEVQGGSLKKILEESRVPLAEETRPQPGCLGQSEVLQERLQDLLPGRLPSEGTSERLKSSIGQSLVSVPQRAPSVLHGVPAMHSPEAIVASDRFCQEGIIREDSSWTMEAPLDVVPLQCGMQLSYPTPLASHVAVLGDKKLFMETLGKLHSELGLHAENLEICEGDIDLHKLYKEVTSRGGVAKVVKEGKWREVFQDSAVTTSISALRKYMSILHHYEQVYFHGATGKIVPFPGAAVEQGDARLCQQHSNELEKKLQKNHGIIDSAHALGVDPASSIGTVVTGAIDGKFENGYLVTVMVGARRMRGVLYHVASTNTTPQNACVPALVQNVGLELKSTNLIPTVGQKRKKSEVFRKDPNAPRQNRTGYNFFFAEQRAKLKTVQPDKDRAISKMIGELWNKLSEDEKYPYQAQGVKDKERYVREMKEYKERTKLSVGRSEILKTRKTSRSRSSLVRVSEVSASSNAAIPVKIQESAVVASPHLSTSSLQISSTDASTTLTSPLPPERTCRLASGGSATNTIIEGSVSCMPTVVRSDPSLGNADKETSELEMAISNVPEEETLNCCRRTASTSLVNVDSLRTAAVKVEDTELPQSNDAVSDTVYNPGSTV